MIYAEKRRQSMPGKSTDMLTFYENQRSNSTTERYSRSIRKPSVKSKPVKTVQFYKRLSRPWIMTKPFLPRVLYLIRCSKALILHSNMLAQYLIESLFNKGGTNKIIEYFSYKIGPCWEGRSTEEVTVLSTFIISCSIIVGLFEVEIP